MAIIQVDHKVLRATAEIIDAYCAVLDQQMKLTNTTVEQMLLSDWIGPDAAAFSERWKDADSSDSETGKYRAALGSCALALKASADAYQEAQEKAYNLAALLPRSWT